MELCHLNPVEIRALDRAQGKVSYAPDGVKEYSELGKKLDSPQARTMLINAFMRQSHAQGGSIKAMAAKGRHGDTKLAYLPKSVTSLLNKHIGSTTNPDTGKQEYFIGALLSALPTLIGAAPSIMKGAAAVGNGLGQMFQKTNGRKGAFGVNFGKGIGTMFNGVTDAMNPQQQGQRPGYQGYPPQMGMSGMGMQMNPYGGGYFSPYMRGMGMPQMGMEYGGRYQQPYTGGYGGGYGGGYSNSYGDGGYGGYDYGEQMQEPVKPNPFSTMSDSNKTQNNRYDNEIDLPQLPSPIAPPRAQTSAPTPSLAKDLVSAEGFVFPAPSKRMPGIVNPTVTTKPTPPGRGRQGSGEGIPEYDF